jgi:hypothetical protein
MADEGSSVATVPSASLLDIGRSVLGDATRTRIALDKMRAVTPGSTTAGLVIQGMKAATRRARPDGFAYVNSMRGPCMRLNASVAVTIARQARVEERLGVAGDCLRTAGAIAPSIS